MQRLLGLGFSAFLAIAGSAAILPVLAPMPAMAQTLDVKAAVADRILGDPKAPVTIYDYSSMTCPHCAHFHATVLPELKTKYIDTGKVKLVFRDFPLDGAALLASAMARCLPEERYFPMIDVLFKQQRSWAMDGDIKRALSQFGKLAGLQQSAVDACWANNEVINGIIQMRKVGETEFKVDSTPTFFINGPDKKIGGAQPVEVFAKLIDPLLK